jgi:hypothetical protein
MSVVLSNNLVLGADAFPGVTIPDGGTIIGWQNLVEPENIASTTEAEGFPITNAANPSTALKWVGVLSGSPESDEFIDIQITDNQDIDFVAIARHNLATAQIPISIETLLVGSPDSEELVQDVILANDGPALFRFTPQNLDNIRIRLQPGIAAPSIAVIYVGKLLLCQRGPGEDHVPVTMARFADIRNGRSESGEFLGRIQVGGYRETSVAFKHQHPGWFRQEFDPFLVSAQTKPFFFAWWPGEYPAEVGYCFMANDPQPVTSFDTLHVSVSLQMRGIV